MTGVGKIFLALSTLMVTAALTAAYIIIPSPSQQHTYELDSKRVDSLDILAAAVNVYVVKHDTLPDSLADLNAAVSWAADDSKDIETKQPYEYTKGQGLAYRLCATFGARSQRGATGVLVHPAGHYCQDRMATRVPKP